MRRIEDGPRMDIHGQATLMTADLADMQLSVPQTRQANATYGFLCAAVVGFLLFAEFHLHPAVCIAAGLAFGTGFFFLRRRTVGYFASRVLARKTPEELEMRYDFNDRGYRVSGLGQSTEVKWDALHGWLDGDNTFSLCTSELTVEVIPKRALRREDLEELVRFLRDHVKTRPPSRVERSRKAATIWIMVAMLGLFLAVYWYYSRGAHP
jgi:hypothetical protein